MSRSTTLRLKQILAGRSQEDLKEAALLAAGRLGFGYVAFSGTFSPRAISREVRFDNLPVDWHRHCADRSRDLLPGSLRRQALREVTPLLWSQASPECARSLAKARSCGIGAGVSCSVRGPGEEWSLTSFALPGVGAASERHISTVLPDCQLIACAIHYAAARIVERIPDRALPLRRLGNGLLSERESQCLIESARGKTTSEIAQALQISERTVTFHLANVRRKLDAANSRHAVSKALSLRLIATG
jgi:LuxR family quorum-sensing system transcriptional regulator CciR